MRSSDSLNKWDDQSRFENIDIEQFLKKSNLSDHPSGQITEARESMEWSSFFFNEIYHEKLSNLAADGASNSNICQIGSLKYLCHSEEQCDLSSFTSESGSQDSQKKSSTSFLKNYDNSNTKNNMEDSKEKQHIQVDCDSKSLISTKQKIKKNKEQLDILDREYTQNHGDLDKKRIRQLSKLTGLKVSQVYKWLWDKKNQTQKLKSQAKHGHYYKGSNPFVVMKNLSEDQPIKLFEVKRAK